MRDFYDRGDDFDNYDVEPLPKASSQPTVENFTIDSNEAGIIAAQFYILAHFPAYILIFIAVAANYVVDHFNPGNGVGGLIATIIAGTVVSMLISPFYGGITYLYLLTIGALIDPEKELSIYFTLFAHMILSCVYFYVYDYRILKEFWFAACAMTVVFSFAYIAIASCFDFLKTMIGQLVFIIGSIAFIDIIGSHVGPIEAYKLWLSILWGIVIVGMLVMAAIYKLFMENKNSK